MSTLFDPHTFLKEQLKTESIHHSGRTLYEHLSNVEKILKICRCNDHVCLAGLFHSIYGTSIFKKQTTNDRQKIKEVIGERAEFLVWIFCNAKRPFCWFFDKRIPLKNGSHIRIDDLTLKELHMIESANLIEQQEGLNEILSFATLDTTKFDKEYEIYTRDENV